VPTVSVIVVTYNSASTVLRSLASIPSGCETIVVDNGSTDGTADLVEREVPHARLVRNERNLGFGAANNIGLSLAKGELALLLNPDAWAEPGAVEALEKFLAAADDAIACGGRLLNPDGSLQESACNRLTLWAVFLEQTGLERWAHSYWISRRAGENPMKVEQVMGACLMMKRVDGSFPRFDERFFLYCEDTELCFRLRRQGSIYYVPQAKFVHALGTSSEAERWRSVQYYNRGKELYFRLHHGVPASVVCILLDRLGALLRLLVWAVATALTAGMVERLRRKVALFGRVLTGPIDPYRARQV
jgi:GT2 family glycosyltransferase